MTTLLTVEKLKITFPKGAGLSVPVDGVSFSIDRGERVALVGESGSGKSLTSLALLRLVPEPGRIGPDSSILLDGVDIMGLEGEALRAIRGGRIGLVFQDPMTSLNPVLTVGYQVKEAVTFHAQFQLSFHAQRFTSIPATKKTTKSERS